ncbi:hypothetical protein RHS01_04775 [Rhizoctonia solani]|uniref:Extracellular membrane protein CFEM domain-containing protein n=1 Tax=Rhizoctonia solani TaxID=456999 RepID=A0A8H7IEB9_9AGAM|nr:hypothetical protein RHS01_04775 [Rhizoctonia solani]
MQFITIALLATASLINAQSVPSSAPGCVKYCLRIAREQSASTAPGACTWAGWCASSAFQDSVSNCFANTCGSTNQQVGQQRFGQCIGSRIFVISSVSESVTSALSSAASSSDVVTTTIGGVATTIPASATSSIASEASSSSESVSSSLESVSASLSSAVSSATAPVSSAINSISSSVASVISSASSAASSAAASPTASPNAASPLGLQSAQAVSLGAAVVGIVAGALML